MRTCSRCHGETPSGLRFCNTCGGRLGEAAPVHGNLALRPDLGEGPEQAREALPYRPPTHLRVVREAGEAPLARVRAVARNLADTLPGRARALAGAAVELAGAARARVHSALQESARGVPAPSGDPVAETRPAPEQVHPDLRVAYRTYLAGREAYERGHRREAARLFAMALRQSPPGSPLGQFLTRVLKPRAATAPARVPPGRRPEPASPVAPELAHPGESPAAAVFGSPAPRRELPAARRGPPAASGDPSGPGDLRVIAGGLAPAREPAARAAVARRRGAPESERTRQRHARERARDLWFREAQGRSPNRPSLLLEEGDQGRDLERVAAVLLFLSGTVFLALLLL